MCIYSTFWSNWEHHNLAPYAIHSDNPWYSQRGEEAQIDAALDPYGNRSRYRTAFEIDKDRITNSQAFRRLEYKTQVFVTHEGDNFRTRLTHSLEVAEIARHMARALRLNENLVEAIALGHDLGHAPYGHVAEVTINEWVQKKLKPHQLGDEYYFCHNRHSLENIDHLEPGYDWDDRGRSKGFGMNLTRAVREGILVHTSAGYRGIPHERANFKDNLENAIRKLSEATRSKGLFYPGTLEAQIVRISDDLAQRIHDLEDGLRSGILKKEHIRNEVNKFFDDIQGKIFNKDATYKDAYLIHKIYGTKMSKTFISHIVEIVKKGKAAKDGFGKVLYAKESKKFARSVSEN